MAIQSSLLLAIVVVGSCLSGNEPVVAGPVSSSFDRSSFPPGFVFGTASASYQYEGAVKEGGRGPSIWDTFSHKYPERISDGCSGDVAGDFYHRYKEDVQIMKEMGMDAFRFSISWSRVLPTGKLRDGVNEEGIKFYDNLIDELLSNGLQPYVTIFHWDVPQALEDAYGGFLSSKIVDDFRDFSDICFERFGDRVKHWITLNEPWTFSSEGYDNGILAPGRGSKWVSQACDAGNSSIEPYLVSHNMLLSHAAAVKVYKDRYQASQKGKIGITLLSHWFVPYSNTKSDKKAAKRALDFMFGWYMDPLTRGEYPRSMRTLVGERLPKFTQEESIMVKGSFDFIGVNYYTANFAADVPVPNKVNISYTTDSLAKLTVERDGIPIGEPTASNWLFVYPKGFLQLLLYTNKRYNNPTIYITENGMGEFNNISLPLEEALKDPQRISYYNRHLRFLRRAIKDGVNVKGYFAWSLLDNYEWYNGYSVRFGINFVDYNDGLKRYAKRSAIWFKNFLQKRNRNDNPLISAF